jgi:hypothetical protein
MLFFLATQESKLGRSWFEASTGGKVHETPPSQIAYFRYPIYSGGWDLQNNHRKRCWRHGSSGFQASKLKPSWYHRLVKGFPWILCMALANKSRWRRESWDPHLQPVCQKHRSQPQASDCYWAVAWVLGQRSDSGGSQLTIFNYSSQYKNRYRSWC